MLPVAVVLSMGVSAQARAQSAIEQLEDMTGSTLDFGSATAQPAPQSHPMPGFRPPPRATSGYAQQVYLAQRRAQSLAAQADLAARQGNDREAEQLLAEAHRLWPDNADIRNALLEIRDVIVHHRANRQLVAGLGQAESAMRAVENLPLTVPGLDFGKLATGAASHDDYPYKNDSSVVDLRFLGAAPGVIDLAHLQGISVRPTAADVSDARRLDQTLAPQEKETNALLADALMTASPGHPLHNPLDDPLEAHDEQVRKLLLQHAISSAYVRASDQSPEGFATMRFHLETDPDVVRKVSLIEQNLLGNETAVRADSLGLAKTMLSQDMVTQHSSDAAAFEAKVQSDPTLRQQVDGQMQAIVYAEDREFSQLNSGALVQARIVAEQWVTQWNPRGQGRGVAGAGGPSRSLCCARRSWRTRRAVLTRTRRRTIRITPPH